MYLLLTVLHPSPHKTLRIWLIIILAYIAKLFLCPDQWQAVLTQRSLCIGKEDTTFEPPVWLTLLVEHLTLPFRTCRTPYRAANFSRNA
ncbi:hypothetical protein ARMGADRAFT_278360 [Armillaria gallica]|uniref:Uncharacterized protein n=1 Tax=Armillaria gallica TaxID=47427 RepID=A0A2H3EQP3_ARMGA|nr:hypothetical protein ARMGADRAFT_278360 [Armillaria gallica]